MMVRDCWLCKAHRDALARTGHSNDDGGKQGAWRSGRKIMRTCLAIIAGTVIARAALATPGLAEDMVRVGNPAGDDFHFSFANVGTEAGIFKKNGLELQIISLAGGAKLHAAMTAGSLDIALGAGTDF